MTDPRIELVTKPRLEGMLPARLGDAALRAAFGSGGDVPADSLHLWGHSFASGVLAGGGGYPQSFGPVLAEKLGLPLRNDGWGGSKLYNNDTSVVPLQQITRPALNRYTPPGGLHVVMWGLNDLNTLGNTTAALAPYKAALRAVVSRMRQGAIYEDDHSSISYQGGWANLAGTAYGSGSSIRYGGATGTGFTITTPAEFPGGTVAVGLASWTDAGGAVISTTVAGVTSTIDTKATARTDTQVHSVLRVPNVPAGAQTLTFTITGSTGAIGAMVDYWAWECPPAEGPLVVLVKQPKPLDLTAYGAVAPGPPTDAGIDALNAIQDQVAAEFGARVLTVDTSGIDHDATCFIAGNVHPTIKGHRYIAGRIFAALSGAVSWRPAPAWNAPRRELGTALPTGPGRYFYQGDRIENTAPVEVGTAGSKYLVTGWVCVADGAPGTWVPTRVLTGN